MNRATLLNGGYRGVVVFASALILLSAAWTTGAFDYLVFLFSPSAARLCTELSDTQQIGSALRLGGIFIMGSYTCRVVIRASRRQTLNAGALSKYNGGSRYMSALCLAATAAYLVVDRPTSEASYCTEVLLVNVRLVLTLAVSLLLVFLSEIHERFLDNTGR